MNKVVYKRQGKIMHLAEAFYTNLVVEPLLPLISKTSITPNSITIFNMFLGLFTCYLALKGRLVVAGIFVQVYLFLDILDGNLARYKDMRSKLGGTLDAVGDKIFYNLIFLSIGLGRIDTGLVILVVILVNLYAIIPTYYIVPRLKKLSHIKRHGLKRIMMEKGFIIGMDLGTVDILLTVFLVIGKIHLLFIILSIGYIFDLIYRIVELKYNEHLKAQREK